MIKEASFLNKENLRLPCDLYLPKGKGPFPCVVFAHGLYSNRKSPRNCQIAQALIKQGIAALLFDFSEKDIFADATWIKHASDLKCALDFLETLPEIDKEKMAVNGSSTGATAALRLAVDDKRIKTVVVRSARVIDVWDRLDKIEIPILIIVGEADEVKDESERLYQVLKSEKKFISIKGAGHLFEEGDTFDRLLKLTVDWYFKKLR